ncbi:MAG TPA: hypothetical protein VGJ20_43295 [Xanthobacteraceae bacterium]
MPSDNAPRQECGEGHLHTPFGVISLVGVMSRTAALVPVTKSEASPLSGAGCAAASRDAPVRFVEIVDAQGAFVV